MIPILDKMIERRAIPHALLFVGDGEAAARAFAAKLLGQERKIATGNHPDLHLYHPEGKTGMHAIEALRSLSHEVAMRPSESPYKVFIIYDAERMLATSSNALLKTLEEPSPQTVILLLTHHPKRLLPTICSRTQVVHFQQHKKIEQSPFREQLLECLLSGSGLDELAVEIEEKKKEWEKELRKGLPRDLSPLQRESQEKEIEGAVALRYTDTIFSLLNTALEWHRDVNAAHVGMGPETLHFPKHYEKLKAAKLRPYAQIEEAVLKGRLAHERSVKLSAIFFHLATLF